MDGRRPRGTIFAPSGADPEVPPKAGGGGRGRVGGVGGAVRAEGHGWPGANHHLRLPCPAMDGRRPRGTMFAPSGADPAWPVGAANMSEPQDAASESIRQRALSPFSALATRLVVGESRPA